MDPVNIIGTVIFAALVLIWVVDSARSWLDDRGYAHLSRRLWEHRHSRHHPRWS